MSYLEQGLRAFQAEHYVEALHMFQAALPKVAVASERERVRMWIARASLAVGDYPVLLDACSGLLSSPDAHVRAFARQGLRQYGISHPEQCYALSAQLGPVLSVALQVYLAQFWPLLVRSFRAGGWTVALSLLGIGWGTVTLGLGQRFLNPVALQFGQSLWWTLLIVVPCGVIALLALDRILNAVSEQRELVLALLGEPARPGPIKHWALGSGVVLISLSLMGMIALVTQWHWWVAVVLALCAQPWLLSLWLVASLVLAPAKVAH